MSSACPYIGSMQQQDVPATPTRLLRRPAVLDRVGVSYTTLWRMYRSGQFPAPIQISAGAVGWRESDVTDWIASRVGAAGR